MKKNNHWQKLNHNISNNSCYSYSMRCEWLDQVFCNLAQITLKAWNVNELSTKTWYLKTSQQRQQTVISQLELRQPRSLARKVFVASSSMISHFACYDVNLSLASHNFPHRYMYLWFFGLYLSLNQYITGFCTVFMFPNLNTITKIIASKFCRCPSGTQGDCCRINNYPM